MNKHKWIILLFLVPLIIFSGCSLPTVLPRTATSSTPGVTQPVSTGYGSNDLEELVQSVYDKVNPSTVNVRVVIGDPSNLLGSSGLGSGFVWDTDGNIVTNNHVVDDATRITVTFYEGSTVDATLVGTDAASDLAVIKVKSIPAELNPVTLADSTQLKVGQLAIAIGNPFGLQSTMTVGFISGLGRLIPADESAVGPYYSIPDVIQTDASLNPGNSGGVLLDRTGKVIGVTSSIATTSGSSSGVGFAIPSLIVKQVIPELIINGHYDHPYIGVSVVSMNPDLANAMNLPVNQRGALIQTVVTGGPAEKAGLKASQQQAMINGLQIPVGGDVIIAYNGQDIKSSDDLITLLARIGKVGQTITLTVLRGGEKIQIEVTLSARPLS